MSILNPFSDAKRILFLKSLSGKIGYTIRYESILLVRKRKQIGLV